MPISRRPYITEADFMLGTAAARPAAGKKGRWYIATDTGLFYYDTGSAWQPVATSIGGTAGGDLSGTYPNPNVSTILGGVYPAVLAGTINTIAASNYSVADTDDTIYAPSSASYTITFKAANAADTLRGGAATQAGRRYTIRRLAGSGVITLASASTFNGPTVLTGDMQVVTYQSDGTTWNAINVEGPDVQTFTASGTWTKPAGSAGANATPYHFARVICIGPGGGGGSGRCDAISTVKGGGSGGGAGAFSILDFPLASLAATETVTVGTGGTGGVGVSTVATNGNVGGNGSAATTFGTTVKVSADNGLGGPGGTAGIPAAPGGAPNGSFTGGVGGQGGDGTTAPTNNSSFQSPSGGGGGGGETVGNAAQAGAAGGLQRSTGRTGGTAGTVNGGAGGAGKTAAAGEPTGGSGGGGGGGNAGVGGAGGAGGIYGAGGGGGGSSRTGSLSGAGGNGANGICVVVCY